MVFSSISKGRCFGLGVGCWLGLGVGLGLVWFGFRFSNALLLLSSTFRNDIFINLSRIGLDSFWNGLFVNSKGRCFGFGVGCWLGVGLGLVFLFSNALLLSLTFRNDIFINLSRIGLDSFWNGLFVNFKR